MLGIQANLFYATWWPSIPGTPWDPLECMFSSRGLPNISASLINFLHHLLPPAFNLGSISPDLTIPQLIFWIIPLVQLSSRTISSYPLPPRERTSSSGEYSVTWGSWLFMSWRTWSWQWVQEQSTSGGNQKALACWAPWTGHSNRNREDPNVPVQSWVAGGHRT